MNPRVTVGILSWNRRDALAVALDSVRRQTIFDECETIVLDNNSADGSREMIRERFPWVALHERETNSGLAEGRNILARLAAAPVVFWMDDDCELVEDDALERLVAEMEAGPDLAVVFGRILEGDGGPPHAFLPADVAVADFAHTSAFPAAFASGGTCVRKQTFLDLGGYDGDFFRMGVENAFAYRAFGAGLLLRYLPAATLVHRPHSAGRNHRVITYYSFRNKLLGSWRYLPAGPALVMTALDVLIYGARSLRSPGRFVGMLHALLGALWRLPRSVTVLRKPMGRDGFSRWAHARHHVIRSEAEFDAMPDRYSTCLFALMELKTRVLRHVGWSRPHPFPATGEGGD